MVLEQLNNLEKGENRVHIQNIHYNKFQMDPLF